MTTPTHDKHIEKPHCSAPRILTTVPDEEVLCLDAVALCEVNVVDIQEAGGADLPARDVGLHRADFPGVFFVFQALVYVGHPRQGGVYGFGVAVKAVLAPVGPPIDAVRVELALGQELKERVGDEVVRFVSSTSDLHA